MPPPMSEPLGLRAGQEGPRYAQGGPPRQTEGQLPEPGHLTPRARTAAGAGAAGSASRRGGSAAAATLVQQCVQQHQHQQQELPEKKKPRGGSRVRRSSAGVGVNFVG
mmetsp:Transcript_17780/g.49660  ORF Transcript_17780/g.49660 Transcript_17780/m.49660 type:complete len:108 (-) Transcript_17780:668-991(-)